jgi:hypothetical protein
MLIRIIKLPFYLALGYFGIVFCGGMEIINLFSWTFKKL